MATIRLLVLFVAVLAIANSIGIAEEPASVRKPKPNVAAPERLARMSFPLPEQESFADDLSLLSDVFAAKIRHPMRDDFPGGKVVNHELDEIFDLLSVWPSEECRQPLIDHFESSDSYVIESAKALLAFQDESTRKIVNKRSSYERSGQIGCLCYVESINELLEAEPSARQSFQPLETLLPPSKREWRPELTWPDGMTCPQAISQLQDENLSVRLQSWAWLASRGIIAPMDAVRESWPRLTKDQQWYILSINPKYIGAERLLAFYEEINPTVSPSRQGHLLERRVELGSESAKEEARGILRRTLVQDDWETLLSKPPGQYARDAICAAPDPEDIPTLVRFRGASDDAIAYSAMLGLYRIDHPDAIKQVEKILLAPRELDSFHLCLSLRWHAEKNLKHRWLYLGALAKALQQRKDINLEYGLLIDAFYAMSGQNFGWNGIPQPITYIDKEAAQTAAKKCIEWYLEECPLRDN